MGEVYKARDTRLDRIVAQSLDTGERNIIVEGTHPHYSPTGHVVFAREASLWALPFDADRLEVSGAPTPLIDGVRVRPLDLANFTVADDGSLVYAPISLESQQRELVWVDREGRSLPVVEERLPYIRPRLSPDGRRVAVEIEQDIWIYSLERRARTRITFEGGRLTPVWTPDGEKVTFSTPNQRTIDWKAADGSGKVETLTAGEYIVFPHSWSRDGQVLAFYENKAGQRDIWILPMEGDRAPVSFVATEFNERSPSFSPDGRWIAYVSDESGRNEVYLQPYSGRGGKVPVSTDGGREPVWCPEGSELFYRNGGRMMVVSVETAPALDIGVPRVLFEGRYAETDTPGGGTQFYDVSRDCQRFVMVQDSDQAPTQLTVVLNWFEELKRLVPGN